MDEVVGAYIEYLSSLKEITKPSMPKFNLSAYTDNEYVSAISSVLKEYECIDDYNLTLQYLKGEK